MFTFVESFGTTNFTYTTGVRAFKQYLIDQLNTERGTRPYYPDYGSLLSRYKYSLLTVQTASLIHSDVYFILSSMDGVTVLGTNFKIDKANKRLEMVFDIMLGQEPIGLHLSYANGEIS